MNFRSTYILLGIVVLAFGGLGIYVLSTGDKKTSLAAEGYLLKALRAANVKADDVTTLEIDLPGQTPDKLVFNRDGKNWVLAAPARARVDSAAIESVITGVLNAKTEKAVDNPASRRLSEKRGMEVVRRFRASLVSGLHDAELWEIDQDTWRQIRRSGNLIGKGE